jgi:hypothetical protein
MPSLTRLAAAILFALFAIYMGEEYKLLYETPPRLGNMSLLLGVVGGFAGWRFVGGRIEGKLIADIFHALQGVILTLILALAVYGTLEVFELGYKMRYSDLWETAVGFFDLTGAHVIRMVDRHFLILMAGLTVGVGVALSLVFRWAERRRFRA